MTKAHELNFEPTSPHCKLFIKATQGVVNRAAPSSANTKPEGHRFVWTVAHSIPQLRVQVLTLALLFLSLCGDHPNTAVSDDEQRKGGDKNTKIVYCEPQSREVKGGGKNKKQNEIHCKLNCLCLKQVCFKKINSMTKAINDNGTIIYSDLSKRLIRHH